MADVIKNVDTRQPKRVFHEVKQKDDKMRKITAGSYDHRDNNDKDNDTLVVVFSLFGITIT